MVTQLAREAGAYVIGTGRAADVRRRSTSARTSSSTSRTNALDDIGMVDLAFDVIGGDIGKRSTGLIRAGGAVVSVVGSPETQPAEGLAIDFVVESDRAQLAR